MKIDLEYETWTAVSIVIDKLIEDGIWNMIDLNLDTAEAITNNIDNNFINRFTKDMYEQNISLVHDNSDQKVRHAIQDAMIEVFGLYRSTSSATADSLYRATKG
jgi:hypothetical protein